MYVTKFSLILPASKLPAGGALALSGQEHDKIECYQGTQAVNNYGISVVGAGSWAKGKIGGSITAYDYRALYQVYNLKEGEAANYWFIKYSKEKNHDELKKTFENSTTVTTKYALEFEIQGNDWGVNAVYITYQVIRLVLNGVTKDYVVTNPPSSGAQLPDGSPYQGGFKPVG
ncbi:unnamed protein product [Gemmata massiliana]|uniref:Uncharacterized protein n=1 Tax=Gemmata massiliana TaxID=1210884 RepID=A0A6P2DC19_9BACT|nr:hypothetical protein [Gemmata massiliana]VTR97895.1 unnamed protein product [Gemmata massiliana]